MKPIRQLIYFSDGSFAYLKPSQNSKEYSILKAHITAINIIKVEADGKNLEITTINKTYKFYF